MERDAQMSLELLQLHCRNIRDEHYHLGLDEALEEAAGCAEQAMAKRVHQEYAPATIEMAQHNADTLLQMKAGTDDVSALARTVLLSDTLTIPIPATEAFQVHALHALTGFVGNLSMAEGQLELAIGKGHIKGGWSAGYPSVNVAQFDDLKQKGCVVTLRAEHVKTIRTRSAEDDDELMAALQGMNDSIMISIGKHANASKSADGTFSGDQLELAYIDFLLKYDQHAHFTYHQDLRHSKHPVVTVVVMLTADKATMHVAGAAKEAASNVLGDAHLLMSQTFHRSGESTPRTVLASFFYKTKKTAPVVATTDTGAPSGVQPEDEGEESSSDEFPPSEGEECEGTSGDRPTEC